MNVFAQVVLACTYLFFSSCNHHCITHVSAYILLLNFVLLQQKERENVCLDFYSIIIIPIFLLIRVYSENHLDGYMLSFFSLSETEFWFIWLRFLKHVKKLEVCIHTSFLNGIWCNTRDFLSTNTWLKFASSKVQR